MNAPRLIIPPSARPRRPVLDLTVSAWKKEHGDLTVYGTWWLDEDGEAPFPCLVIVPTHKSMKHSYVPCVVTIDLAWIWSEESGDDEFAMEKAIQFADALQISVDMANCNRIRSIIRDHIGDLLRIGPRPLDLKTVVAEAVLKREDGSMRHAEIKDV